MSKNRNNYSKMYTKENRYAEETTDTFETKEVVEEVIEEVVNEAPKAVGHISNCEKLNIRTEPNANGEVVTILPVGTELSIDLSESNDEWYKICTLHGIEGYCMKKFVYVRE